MPQATAEINILTQIFLGILIITGSILLRISTVFLVQVPANIVSQLSLPS
jgi:hypothetical protein